MIKFVAYGWSAERSLPAVRDQVDAALTAARHTGWEGLLAEQRAYLDDFWDRADVEVEGDAELQQAVRFALFHVLQAGARAEQRAIPAKGLTGPGYDGHAFWDTESFVLPVLTYTAPEAAADALRWRHQHARPGARAGRASWGCEGAAFPWRTIARRGVLGLLAGGTAAFHVNADIADAVIALRRRDRRRRVRARRRRSSCWSRRRGCGARSATTTPQGRFRIDGVTGPDEYSAIADNNVYTNLMAAAEPARSRRRRPSATRIGPRSSASTTEEIRELARRRRARCSSPTTRRSACTRRPRVHRARGLGLRRTPARAVPAAAALPVLRPVPQAGGQAGRPGARDALARRRVHRRAEGAELRLLRGAHGARLLAVRLHPGGIAAEVGHLDLAYDYLAEAALMDLRDLEHNTRDGVHIASLAGTWIALVAASGACATTMARSLRAAAAGWARQDRVLPGRQGAAAAGRGYARDGHVLRDGRPPAGDLALRRKGARIGREAADSPAAGGADPAPAQPAAWTGACAPEAHRRTELTRHFAQAGLRVPQPGYSRRSAVNGFRGRKVSVLSQPPSLTTVHNQNERSTEARA